MTTAVPSPPGSPAHGDPAATVGSASGAAVAATRVRRLLLWYPRGWRDRYGDEFAELLIAEQAEQGASWLRSANVAATGLRARLAAAGLAGHPLDPSAAAPRGPRDVRVLRGRVRPGRRGDVGPAGDRPAVVGPR